MSNSIVAGVYRHVIDEVISTVQKDFEDMGVDESILQELQRSWETKIANARVANFVVSDPPAAEGYSNAYFDESGNPVKYAEQYTHAPSIEGQEYAYGQQYQQQQSHGVAAANLATLASASSALKQDNGVGAPQTYMPPRPEEQTQTSQVGQQAAASYYNTIMLPSDNNGQNFNANIPQTDGSSDMTTQEIDELLASRAQAKSLRKISQVDGEDDEDEDEDGDEDDEAEPTTLQYNSEDAINSDLDDTDDDDHGEDGGEEMEHIVLCQYDKVTRTKNKWKCVLKDGIMLVNGKDYLFHKVNGDFEW
ncbi:transcription factor IIA subunit alpha [Basidiobolus ranarum]|uniref:Transcription factor IIA subunit alpha n=1 Tax=Basidiobolus ranarum TaxID=34480 RepID=A0ABR2VVM3_9FUNG